MANMLKRALQRLNGSVSSGQIAAALEVLHNSRESQLAKLVELEGPEAPKVIGGQRAQALREFDYDRARQIESESAQLRRELAAENMHEFELKGRLSAALAAESSRALERYQEQLAEIYEEAKKHLSEAAAQFGIYAMIRDQAAREFPAHLFDTKVPRANYLGFVMPDNVLEWAREMDRGWKAARKSDRTEPRPIQVAAPPVPRAEPPKAKSDLGGPISLNARPLTAEQLARLHSPIKHDDLPLESGQVRAAVLRQGYPLNGDQCRSGQRIRLAAEVAKKAAWNGAIEIIEEFSGPRPGGVAGVLTAAEENQAAASGFYRP